MMKLDKRKMQVKYIAI